MLWVSFYRSFHDGRKHVQSAVLATKAGATDSPVPRIHVFPRGEDVDVRDKHHYDGERGSTLAEWDTNFAVTGDNASPARRIAHD